MPKLGLLSVARGTEHESGIPVIDSYSEEFNLELKEILVTAKFWVRDVLMEANRDENGKELQVIYYLMILIFMIICYFYLKS